MASFNFGWLYGVARKMSNAARGKLFFLALALACFACGTKGDAPAAVASGGAHADAGTVVAGGQSHSAQGSGGNDGADSASGTSSPPSSVGGSSGVSPRSEHFAKPADLPFKKPVSDEAAVRTFLASRPRTAAAPHAAPPAPQFAPNQVKDLSSCSSVTLTSDHPSSTFDVTGQYAVKGQTLVWTAAASCASPQYQFNLRNTDNVWTTVQPWSTSATFTWDTSALPTGYWLVQVLARNGTSGAEQSSTITEVMLNDQAACTALTVTSDHSPVYPPYAVKGDTVHWTATSTCPGPAQYQFQLLAPGASSFVAVQDWSSSPTFNWNTAGVAIGQWWLIVVVRDVPFAEPGYSQVYAPAEMLVNDYAACTSATVTADDADYYAVPGQQVHWTAVANCAGPAEYRFVFDDPTGVWSEAQAWSSKNTYTWDTTNQPLGYWGLQVWVRDAPFYDYEQAYAWNTFILNSSQPCLSITSTPSARTIAAGTQVTVQSTVQQCTTSEFEVWHQPPGGAWARDSAYSPANANYTWDTTGVPVGLHTFQVRTRTQGSPQEYQTYASFYVNVLAGNEIPTATPLIQDFNALGPGALDTLPANWLIDKQSSPRTVGTFGAARTQTELAGGASLAPNAANGIYNFGAGTADPQSPSYWLNSTDRAPGWLADGADLTTGGTKSGNLYVALRAPADKDLQSLEVGYDLEQYRKGVNPLPFHVQLFSSPDGTTWTNAGNQFVSAFGSDVSYADTNPAPGNSTTVHPTTLPANIFRGKPFYLAWNYTVDSPTSNNEQDAQALGIDNVSIKGSGQCVPNCAAKHCGDNPSDGCGGTCTIVCADGDVGCSNDSACNAGSTCSGKTFGSASPNICVPPVCLSNPRLGGCGHPGDACGPSCTSNPTCKVDQDCPSGYLCGNNNGFRYGVPGANVCEKPACRTDAVATGCGTITSECGTCVCTPNCSTKHCGDADLSDGCGGTCLALCENHSQCTTDVDCQGGSLCVHGAGARVGLRAGANVCLPSRCVEPNLAAPDCGSTTSTCGTCPAISASCGSRECGTDPETGAQCGATCPNGEYCSVTGHCSTFDPTTPIFVHGADGLPKPFTPPAAPQASSVGATPGQFSVSERGSATYSVPINVPPGRAGIEPSLGIRYASSTGNGALGVGWSLDGLSTIDRCQRTYAQDGYAQPVTVTAGDALCLDGQRLVQVAPDEYRTEVDTFQKVQVLHTGADSTTPDHFKVFTKEGRILTYGDTADSKGSPLNGQPRTWALTRVEDRFGNFMRIVYRSTHVYDWDRASDSVSELLPDSISYTGHGVDEGDRQLKFDYSANRPDRLTGNLVGGGLFVRTLRLDKIEVRTATTGVRNYSFSYSTAPNNTLRLDSLQECSGATSVCKPPTSFTYFNEQGFDAGTQFTPPTPDTQYGGPQVWMPYGQVLRTSGGYDVLSMLATNATNTLATPIPAGADMAVLAIPAAGPAISGIIDLVNAAGASINVSDWVIRTTYDYRLGRYSYENPCDANHQPADHVLFDNTTNSDSLYETCPETHNDAGGYQFTEAPRVWLLDVDGDGVQDKLYCDHDQLNLNYKLSQTGSLHKAPLTATDQTADGKILAPELCAQPDCALHDGLFGAGIPSQFCPERFPKPETVSFDVDGDGTGNLLVRKYSDPTRTGGTGGTGTWEALIFDATGPHFKALSTDTAQIDAHHFQYFVLDYNGDGLRDILALPSARMGGSIQLPVLWENVGDAFRLHILNPAGDETAGQAPYFPGFVIDYDHDGRDDLIEPNPAASDTGSHIGRPWIIRRIGDNQITSETMPLSNSPGFPGVLGDFNGDGNPDLMTRDPEVGYFMHHGLGRRQSLLKTVTDGLGNHVEINYDPRDPEATYTTSKGRRSLCSWPTSCLATADTPLVGSYVQSHYLDRAHTSSTVDGQISLWYGQAYADSGGLGWLGFDSRQITARDGAGALQKITDISYRPIEASSAAAPIAPPYARPLAGLTEETIENYAHADSTLVPRNPPDGVANHLQVSTKYSWARKVSSSGRPFAALDTKTTQVAQADYYSDSEEVDGFLVGRGPLFGRTETFTVDSFDNITDKTVTEQDFDPGTGAVPAGTAIPGSTSTLTIHSTYQPTAQEIANWLIGLKTSEDVTDQPRCRGSALICPEKKQTRHSDFYYYDTGWQHLAVRESGDPTLYLSVERIPDGFGNLEQLIATNADGSSRSRIIDYDDRRLFPTSLTNAKNQVTQVRVDDRFGRPVAVVDPNEIGETWSYDDWGALRHHHSPREDRDVDYEPGDLHSGPFTFAIPAAYHVLSSVAGGQTVDKEFDGLGHVVQTETSGFNGQSVFEEFEYDGRSRLVTQSRPHLAGDNTQSVVHFDYDALDRLIAETQPNGAVTQHAYAFETSFPTAIATQLARATGVIAVEQVTDPGLHVTLIADDRRGKTAAVVDAVGGENDYEYGAFGALQKLYMDTGDTIQYETDAYGRMTSTTDAAFGGSYSRTFDGFDEVVSQTDPRGRSTSLFYDLLGRIDHIEDTDGIARWTYDGSGPNEVGRLISTVSSTGQETDYAYEPPSQAQANRGLLASVTEILTRPSALTSSEPTTLVTKYHYDAYSRLEQIDYPGIAGAPFSVKNGYDFNGNVVSVSDANAANTTYWQLVDPDQGYRIKSEKLGNGAVTTRTYEALTGRLSTLTAASASASIQNWKYQYNTEGSLIERDNLLAQTTEAFDYDALHRLGPNSGVDYTLGANHIQNQDGVGGYTYYESGRDWIQEAGDFTYTHDPVGNIDSRTGPSIPGGTQVLNYTNFGLPSSISLGDGAPALFAYSGDDGRAVKEIGTQATFYAGDLYQATVDGAARSHRYMIYAGGRAVAAINQDEPGGSAGPLNIQYLHGDNQGSIQAITTADGSLSSTRSFGAFGRTLGDSADFSSVPYGYTGQEDDAELGGLVNMRGRMYDPVLAQFR